MIKLAKAQLGDVVDHTLQKISVVGHHDQAAPELPQPFFQPCGHLGVQMVGGLVQHQHVGRVDQCSRQRHTFALAARKGAHLLIIIGDAQLVEHGFGLKFIERPEVGRKVEKHLLQHSSFILHGRILRQVADLYVGIAGHRALVGGKLAHQHLQEGGFSRSVNTDDAGFVSVVQIKIHVLQQPAVAKVD